MRKVFALLLAVCFVLFFSLDVSAQVRKPGFGLGFRAGAQQIKDVDLDVDLEAEFDAAPIVGVTGTFNVNPYLSFEAALDYSFDRDVDVSTMGVTVPFGEFSQTAATLGLRAHIPTGSAFDPYFGGGIGYYWNSFDLDSFFTGAGLTMDVDDDLGWFLNAGFEIFMGKSRNAALCFDFRYTWLSAELTMSAPGLPTETQDVDLDGFMGTIGFKYYF